jgi:hypothetical protein
MLRPVGKQVNSLKKTSTLLDEAFVLMLYVFKTHTHVHINISNFTRVIQIQISFECVICLLYRHFGGILFTLGRH